MRYRTIVADPPWPYPEGWGRMPSPRRDAYVKRHGLTMDTKPRKTLPYPSMSVDAIANLPVRDFAELSGCHVYLWTTNRHLNAAFDVFRAWGVRYGQTVVWAKTPCGLGPGGTFTQSTEYVLFGRIGTLRHTRRVDSTWFNWPRSTHSRKPEAFLDLVEQVSPGPYLEMFARRNRLGWDTWGNEALEHVQVSAS